MSLLFFFLLFLQEIKLKHKIHFAIRNFKYLKQSIQMCELRVQERERERGIFDSIKLFKENTKTII